MACAAAVLLAASFVFAADSANDSSGHSPRFRKITLSKEFWSEGATVGDFNKDGKLDYAAGGFWYEGPDFQKKHTYYQGSPVDPHGYSKNFFGFARVPNTNETISPPLSPRAQKVSFFAPVRS